jgi:signal transduction histidine kinase
MSEITFTLALRRYQTLIEIARDLATVTDLDTLLLRIVKVAEDLVKAEAASLLLYDDVHCDLYFKTISIGGQESSSNYIVPEESIAGYVATHREPVYIEDVNKDPRFIYPFNKAIDIPIKSMIAIPLITHDKCIGVLEVFNKKDEAFNKEDEGVLLALGAQASIAIENARLFKQADLISELVHEIRTPLTSITTIAYLLERSELTEEQRTSLARTISEETMRLSDMATSFLDLARLESGRMVFLPEPISIPQILQECVNVVEPKAYEMGICIHIEVPQDILPALEADRDKIKQVLLNILSNAVKYNRYEGTIEIRAWKEDQFIYISIRDTGPGIPENELPHIFEKFYRAKGTEKSVSGTGLGLSICKKIIENHGGTIEVQSSVDVGSTFIIKIPQHFMGS